MTTFTIDKIAATRAELAGQAIRTPVLPLCGSKIAAFIPPGAELFLKMELFQQTGSFKARGAALGVGWLADEQRRRGRGPADPRAGGPRRKQGGRLRGRARRASDGQR